MDDKEISNAVNQYIDTALWSETDDDGEPLDARWKPGDIALASLMLMGRDVRTFIDACEAERPDVFEGMEGGQVGHDFWLTRNRHGAGFWDRGLGELGTWLTEVAHAEGSAGLYVGDDMRIYYGYC